ncbi:MAG: helix-turn-helix transcriptional regulator [Alphaproteobacteria bacterium]
MSKNQTQQPHGAIYERFGRNVANARAALGLSQSEVAARLGMPQSTYRGYESGTRKIPLSVIVQLSDFYGVSPDDLISGEVSAPAAVGFDLSPLEKQIVIRFRSLPDGERNMILRSLGIDEEKGVVASDIQDVG